MASPPLSTGERLFCAGTASVFSEICTLPIDVVKVRLQLQGSRSMLVATQYVGMMGAFKTIVRTEGVFALWKGIKPACLRQATYGTMRLGFYDSVKQMVHKLSSKNSSSSPLWEKIAAGTISGAFAAAICTPTDLIKVRMQGNIIAKHEAQSTTAKRYQGLTDAFVAIVREDGWKGLYKGVSPTVQRAAILAAAELGTYDEVEQQILQRGWLEKGFGLHFAASLVAGFVAAIMSSPADVIKSRVMNQTTQHYTSTWDCACKSVREEGFFSLWKGFWPNYARLAPSVAIMFLSYEAMKSIVAKQHPL